MGQTKKKAGRPAGRKRTEDVSFVAFPWEHRLIKEAAEKSELPVAEYVRNTLLAHARLVIASKGGNLAPLPNEGDPLLRQVNVVNLGDLPAEVTEAIQGLIRLTREAAQKKTDAP